MKKAYLIYKTDVWHSHKSKELIGIATTQVHLIRLIRQQCKKENVKLTDEDKYQLSIIKQTQGYSGTGEFLIEEIDINTLL
jgi:hypothetical protein